ncbi:RNA polymerase sigma factor [Brevundimonas sp.]|uniref:RNA polymerase sigma factor n=1 Tax=Brevundimonas sp. TaxID=1871086 RepID=UPI0025C6D88F|nr:RNA polymerase sigma factor [Brevundimonas sp.]
MSASSTRTALRDLLTRRYADLRKRLAIRLGSADLAGEALHETWIKLQDGAELAPIEDPDAYIYRAAVNTAFNLSAAQRRVLGHAEIADILNLADDAPGPEQIVMARSDLMRVWRVLDELTPRQRTVFLESFTGSASHDELAVRFNVSLRMIQMDLRDAILHCARRTRRKNPFVRGRSRVSVK